MINECDKVNLQIASPKDINKIGGHLAIDLGNID